MTLCAATAAIAGPAILYGPGGKLDRAYNQAGFEASEAWKVRTGASYQDAEITNDSQREQLVRRHTALGDNPVILVGPGWDTVLAAHAGQNGDTTFVVVNGPGADASNVRAFVFNVQEDGFLAGAAAALATTENLVAIIEQVNIARPVFAAMYCGFLDGAAAVDPKVSVIKETRMEVLNADGSFNSYRDADVVFAPFAFVPFEPDDFASAMSSTCTNTHRAAC